MCGMAVTIWSTGGFESKYVWNVVNLVLRKYVGMAVTIWSTCGFERKYVYALLTKLVLSQAMCGMAVLIRPTCGFESKYVWYGLCYNLVNLLLF